MVRAQRSSSRSRCRARRRRKYARCAAKAVANSPLVKTAFYGGDANWGRIWPRSDTPAHGSTCAPADLWIEGERGKLQLVAAGQPLAYSEDLATAIFQAAEISVTVELGLAAGHATVWTCDLSHAYVDINGSYRT